MIYISAEDSNALRRGPHIHLRFVCGALGNLQVLLCDRAFFVQQLLAFQLCLGELFIGPQTFDNRKSRQTYRDW